MDSDNEEGLNRHDEDDNEEAKLPQGHSRQKKRSKRNEVFRMIINHV